MFYMVTAVYNGQREDSTCQQDTKSPVSPAPVDAEAQWM